MLFWRSLETPSLGGEQGSMVQHIEMCRCHSESELEELEELLEEPLEDEAEEEELCLLRFFIFLLSFRIFLLLLFFFFFFFLSFFFTSWYFFNTANACCTLSTSLTSANKHAELGVYSPVMDPDAQDCLKSASASSLH